MENNDPVVEHAPASNATGRHLVILGPFAFIKGWLISVTLSVGTLCIFVVAQELGSSAQSGSGGNHVPGIAMIPEKAPSVLRLE